MLESRALLDAGMNEELAVAGRDAIEKAERFQPNFAPATRDVLERLRGDRKRLGVSSGRLAAIGWRKLKAAGLRAFFEFGGFADDCEWREQGFRKGVATVAPVGIDGNRLLCWGCAGRRTGDRGWHEQLHS
jgi:phosphoglycolate phosphatase-like HAD superfamily hydrolase